MQRFGCATVIPTTTRATTCLKFGDDFELDLRAYELRDRGIPIKMKPIPMELLRFLVERRGDLVTREEIVERIWGKGVFLDTDNSINGAISRIRQVLRDKSEQPRFVQTVTGKGYRFIASVEEVSPAASPAPAAKPAPSGESLAMSEPHSSVGAMPSFRRWPFLLASSLLLVVALGFYFLRGHSPAKSQPSNHRVMLAVLPFDNLTGESSQDYFSDGMTEELITELGRLNPEHLGVIARTSVMLYKNNPKPLDQVGRDLGVEYVLEGSVRRDANRVRITAQLIQVSDQTHLWARQYDRELKDLLLVQSEIARSISDEIQTPLGDYRPTSAVTPPPLSPQEYEAHDLYLQGRYFWNKRTEDGFQQAIGYFQQAIAKDPNYAPAYAGLADTFALMSTWNEVPQNEFMPKARTAALKALEIDERSAEAHTSLGLIAEAYDYDWAGAEKEFRRAIELNPDYATAHQWYAEYLSWQGRVDEALAEAERARQLDPLSLIIAVDQGAIYYRARQYDRAIAQGRAILEMDPNLHGAQDLVFASLLQEGKFAEALVQLEAVAPRDSPWYWADKSYLCARWGRTAEAEHAQAKMEEFVSKLGLNPTWIFVVAYANTQKKDKVITLLDEGFVQHSYNFAGLKVDPVYDPLRGDPRFQDLLRRLGLAQQ